MALLEKPEDYEALGIEPPESIVNALPGGNNPAYVSQDHAHKWHQIGFEVYCDEGNNRHGRMVETNKILTGTDEFGLPIYRLIDV